MTPEEEKREEQRLFNIAKKVLYWGGVDDKEFSDEEVWGLVMLDLVNIK